VQEPPGAEGVKEPPGAEAVKEPPGSAGVKEPPPVTGVKEPPGSRRSLPTAAPRLRSTCRRPRATGSARQPAQPPLALFYAILSFTRLEVFKMLLTSFFPLLILILAVLGSIVMGLATPTEAAAVGALGGFLLAWPTGS
jgi:TRAP-type mannitol/chloroaromatic compound transport system permease large subunit